MRRKRARKSRWSTWHFAEIGLEWELPASPGVYAVYLDGSLSYIGSSCNIKQRFGQYPLRLGYGTSINTPWGWHRSVMVKTRSCRRFGEWAMRELRLIRRLKPKFNKRLVGAANG